MASNADPNLQAEAEARQQDFLLNAAVKDSIEGEMMAWLQANLRAYFVGGRRYSVRSWLGPIILRVW